MFIPEKMKLNKFRDCAIPSNREYFQRLGFAVPAEGSFAGENEPVPMPMNKVESADDYERYVEQMAAEAAEKSE